MSNSRAKEMLQDIIGNFSPDKFERFFRNKSRKFKSVNKSIDDNDEHFRDVKKIGQIEFEDTTELSVYSIKVKKTLSERSSKKAQYEKGKKILKQDYVDAGIFIFYDEKGDFRFSLIYTDYQGAKRKYSYWRRFTYFVSKKQTNKTFLKRIGEADFSTIEKIKDAFSVEKVTKEFYQEIANWYFWALENATFPEDVEKEKNGKNMAVIRLITRIMFIWFLKIKLPELDKLFKEEEIKEILEDFSADATTYYKAILQNLFFATLNIKQEDRKFRSEIRGYRGYNPDYGNPNVYRYHSLFKDPDKMEEYFKDIPFLNGGLFECLDYKPKGKGKSEERIYIDGFTDTKKYQPNVPNFLFFNDEINIDLNYAYGSKGKRYRVEGLINILSRYNFTIDEDEPDDLDVALNPELLGRVFENLLASYNPETATTARKVTGSYYTPPKIVDYMVEQSLFYYFKTHLSDVPDIDKKLETLFSKDSKDNPFDPGLTKKMISLIEQLRIVDPAVGSGAFPMGILNKLVFLLSKLDPQNILWKEMQLEAIKKNVKDPILREKLIRQAEEHFRKKDINYLRKLYLIEKCIYGVDIQQIAVEIAKLRFFISLLVDEKVDRTKPNFGIEPLPNLDFKLMQGNSLISSFYGIDFVKRKSSNRGEQFLLNLTSKYDELIKEFEELKHQYQNEPDKDKKDELKKEIDTIILKIFEERLKEALPEFKKIEENATKLPASVDKQKWFFEERRKLSKKYGFDIEEAQKDLVAYTEGRKPKNFFLWDIYFAEVFSGENPGFDIVIGNPPYIQLQKAIDKDKKYADLYKNQGYKTFERTGDIYCLFYEKGIDLLKENGLLVYITSNKWMRAGYGQSLRGFLSKYDPLVLLDLGPGIFSSATVDTNILLIRKRKTQNINLKALTFKSEYDISNFPESVFTTLTNLSNNSWIIFRPIEEKIKKRIEKIDTPLRDWDISIYRGILTGYNEAFIIDNDLKERLCREDPKSADIIKPILRGRDIKRYKTEWAGLWLINTHNGYTNSKGVYILPVDVKNYPAIKRHLDQYWKSLVKRQDKGATPYNLRNCAYIEEFEKEKIVWQRITHEPTFCMSISGEFILDSMAFISSFDRMLGRYVLSILNSMLIRYWVNKNVHQYGDTGYRLSNQYVEQILVKHISASQQKPFEILVDYILFLKQQSNDNQSSYFEQIIDGMVYELYFEDEMKRVGCEIAKYLVKLPEITRDMSDTQKHAIINSVFDKLYNKNHPVYKSLTKMKESVEEIKWIEGICKRD